MTPAREIVGESLGAHWRFVCQGCAAEFSYGPQIAGCPNCRRRGASGLLELVPPHHGPLPAPHERNTTRGLLRYLDLLLPIEPGSWISLEKVDRSRALPRSRRHVRLQQSLVQAGAAESNAFLQGPLCLRRHKNAARSFGYRRVAVSSTGNLGVSTAAYCAAAGMECLVIVPDDTPGNMISEASLYGARVAVLDK